MSLTVGRLGFAAIKGTRHHSRAEIALTADGPVGDRRFCLVDPHRRRALRTVQNPRLVAVRADWADPRLRCGFPDGRVVEDEVAISDRSITFDYWGRRVAGQIVDGPWAAAFGSYLGGSVVLVHCDPGRVVFGDPVTMITRSSLQTLAASTGSPVEPARWRATIMIDDAVPPGRVGDLASPVEADWVGQRLRVGMATVLVSAAVARCAVIDIHPGTGDRDGRLLTTLGRQARRDPVYGDPIFGVQARVVEPGSVRTGDRAELIP